MRAILRFYLPLAFPAVLVGVSHAVVSWALTRMPDAAVVLSAYALAAGMAQLCEAPVIAVRQTAMALVRSLRNWRIVRAISWGVALCSLALQLLVIYGPWTEPVLRGLFRVPEHLFAPTLTIFSVYLGLVVVSTWRFLHQGVTIGNKRPLFVTAGMVVRLPVQMVLAYGAVYRGWLPPLWVGPVLILSAIGVEALVAYIGSRRLLQSMPEEESTQPLTMRSGLTFLLPLAASFVIYAVGRPAINAAVGSTPHAEPALATLSIIYILFFAFLGPLQALHQVAVLFPRERRRTFGFALVAGLGSSLVLLLLGATLPGSLLLFKLFEVPADLREPLVAAVRTMAVWPVLFAVGDYLQGILILERNTRPVGMARVAGVLTSVGLVKLSIGAAGTPSAAVSLAVAGMAAGAAAETIVMYGLRRLSTHDSGSGSGSVPADEAA